MGDKKYSEIEIQTAKNLIAKGYEWIARDEDDALYAFKTKPRKGGYAWNYGGGVLLLVDENAKGVIPIFDDINWEDAEPVRLRDIVPQILTDEEREWLRMVVSEHVKCVIMDLPNFDAEIFRRCTGIKVGD